MPETERRYWFVVWDCKCTDVKGSPEALDPRCPGHDKPAMDGSPFEVTAGVSTNLGHLCADLPPCHPTTPLPAAAATEGDTP